MRTGFNDPKKIRSQKPKDRLEADFSETSHRLLWDFACPQYDQRTSCFIKAGTDYNVGHRTPVGTKEVKGHLTSSKIIPFGRINTMKVDED